MPLVSVIIPTMKGREQLLNKLLASLPDDVERIIVDDEDLLLAAKRNKGARLATGKYLFFIDDDNYLEEFAITEMLKKFNEEIGVMGMTACYDDKKRIVADGGSYRNYLTGFTKGARTNRPLSAWYRPWLVFETYFDQSYQYKVDEVANAFMIRREVFEDVGGFDEVNFPIDLDEADICKRIKNMGYKIVMNPTAICYHKSITYSHIPNFRRPLNAYFHGRNRQIYQRKFNSNLRYGIYLVFFFPVFVGFYTLSLLWRKNAVMIPHFLKGVRDGLLGRRENPYQKRQV